MIKSRSLSNMNKENIGVGCDSVVIVFLYLVREAFNSSMSGKKLNSLSLGVGGSKASSVFLPDIE